MFPNVAKPSRRDRTLAAWPVLLALLLAGFVYRDVGRFGFINYDDPVYVSGNPHVLQGLTPAGLGWAFTTGHAGVWVPATWVSLQADATLAGDGPAGFHRTNLLLHLLNVVLVFLLAWRLCGSAPAAAVIAALFGVHPVNVEAVAWVTARKDLLMAAFLLGSLLLGLAAADMRRRVGAGALAALAMLAKPAAVIAGPLLLLVVRSRAWKPSAMRRAWKPDLAWAGGLVALAAAVSLAAIKLAPSTDLAARFHKSLPVRCGEAAVGVFRYLRRLAWPADLAVRYRDQDVATTLAPALLAIAALAGLTWAAYRWRRRAPLVALGWGWFLLCLLPSLGIVQGGQLPLADRYAYVAGVGVWLALAGAALQLAAGRRAWRAAALVLGMVACAAATTGSLRQVATWRDDDAFWSHALAVNPDSELAHVNLGLALDAQRKPAEALAHLDAALALVPRGDTHYNAGNACLELGRTAEAERHFRAALQLKPELMEASLNLGALLAQQGRLDDARLVLLAAEERHPDVASLQYNLALIASLQGDAATASDRCRRTLKLDPSHAGARELFARLAAATR